jgi:hypothetical protein
MIWSKKACDIILDWCEEEKRVNVEELLIEEGLVEIVEQLRLDGMVAWKKIVKEALSGALSLAEGAAVMGRKGGLVKSKGKGVSSVLNGQKGGRPNSGKYKRCRIKNKSTTTS